MVTIRSFAVYCRCRIQDDDGLDNLFAMMSVGEAPEPGFAVSTKVRLIPPCHGRQHLGVEVHIIVHLLVFEPYGSSTVRPWSHQVSASETRKVAWRMLMTGLWGSKGMDDTGHNTSPLYSTKNVRLTTRIPRPASRLKCTHIGQYGFYRLAFARFEP